MNEGYQRGTTIMNGNNFINLKRHELDKFVYRIVSKERLFEIFTTNENVLVRPSKWDDSFENFILRSKGRLKDGTIVDFGFNKDFYGQCWTLHSASDAMWRIYSPDGDGVRIRTTIRRLDNSLSCNLGEWAHVQCFIGKVDYLGQHKILEFAKKVFLNGLDPHTLARTLLVKRWAFKHEREVRLLYFEKGKTPDSDLFRYKVDPHVLIEQIMIDSRLTKKQADSLKQEIRKRTGYEGEIKRSLLYAPPKNMILPVG